MDECKKKKNSNFKLIFHFKYDIMFNRSLCEMQQWL